MKRKMWKHAWVLIPTLLIGACTYDVPGDEEMANEQLVSVTQYVPGKNFSVYQTIALPVDTIVYVNDNNSKDTLTHTFLVNDDTKQILSQIKQILQSYNYTVVNKGQPADLAMDVTWVKLSNTVIYSDWWYYYDWWYWWDWYPYYPPYYPSYYVTSYTTGNLVMRMADLTAKSNNKAPIIWGATVRSILDGTHFSDSEINRAIRDCFTQTPNFGR